MGCLRAWGFVVARLSLDRLVHEGLAVAKGSEGEDPPPIPPSVCRLGRSLREGGVWGACSVTAEVHPASISSVHMVTERVRKDVRGEEAGRRCRCTVMERGVLRRLRPLAAWAESLCPLGRKDGA